MSVPTLYEGKRGCGYRKGGGLYLMSDGLGVACPKLPIELHVCPVCSSGIKPTRGYTWIEADPLVDPGPHGSVDHDAVCALARPIGRAGLLWIGEKFYSPESFTSEAVRMGVSRRISAVPKDFVVGETLVFVASRSACPCEDCDGTGKQATVDPLPGDDAFYECERCDGTGTTAGIFHAFRPQRIEYVVKGDESDEDLERLRKRGIRPVHVKPLQMDLDDIDGEDE